ncbi:hypothetical protein BU204_25900 [Actinophytocola xanthii]|uniref:Uncharacterized protein n=1 Tax=Actinophytocola xanthii TaxID=1912961 RepID=A0A1Q8CJY5_9PSEU|nr:hypothetical protein BU204_25900 [Actinophytocola xanthii]
MLAIVAAFTVVLVAGAVLIYPAWRAKQGNGVKWTTDITAGALLDYDEGRLLLVDTTTGPGQLTVVNRRTGGVQQAGTVDLQRRASLVPDGVVASVGGELILTGADGDPVWTKKQGLGSFPLHTLVAVDLDAGVVLSAVDPPEFGGSLTAFAIADGAPVWTIPNINRVGNFRIKAEPVRPPGALRDTTLIPVIRQGDFGPHATAMIATWSLVSVKTHTFVTTVVEDTSTGNPLATGAATVPNGVADCSALTVAASSTPVRWKESPPAVDCDLVPALDSTRVLMTARREAEQVGGRHRVTLLSLTLESGEVTRLDWRGTLADTYVQRQGRELQQSWGRFLFLDGVVYDTTTGQKAWTAEEAWITDDGAVVAERVTGIDRLVTGASDDSRWLRLVDPRTGDATGGSYISDQPVTNAYPVDDEALIITTSKITLLGDE